MIARKGKILPAQKRYDPGKTALNHFIEVERMLLRYLKNTKATTLNQIKFFE
jgi:hypothetical protein